MITEDQLKDLDAAVKGADWSSAIGLLNQITTDESFSQLPPANQRDFHTMLGVSWALTGAEGSDKIALDAFINAGITDPKDLEMALESVIPDEEAVEDILDYLLGEGEEEEASELDAEQE